LCGLAHLPVPPDTYQVQPAVIPARWGLMRLSVQSQQVLQVCRQVPMPSMDCSPHAFILIPGHTDCSRQQGSCCWSAAALPSRKCLVQPALCCATFPCTSVSVLVPFVIGVFQCLLDVPPERW
jgi:hypothetical protein